MRLNRGASLSGSGVNTGWAISWYVACDISITEYTLYIKVQARTFFAFKNISNVKPKRSSILTYA